MDGTLSIAESAPLMLPVQAENIPAELRELEQWLLWRFERDGKGKWSKIPYQSRNPRSKAASIRPAEWSSFDEALAVHHRDPERWGVGFVFARGGGLVGIDLDKCRDPETGKLTADAQEIIDRARTYCEVSPSGTGVKLIGRGVLPIVGDAGGKRIGGENDYRGEREGGLEVYMHSRYFTITGHLLSEVEK